LRDYIITYVTIINLLNIMHIKNITHNILCFNNAYKTCSYAVKCKSFICIIDYISYVISIVDVVIKLSVNEVKQENTRTFNFNVGVIGF